ncbi:MAG: hypothetical protein AB7L18_12390, partial [Hyphomicrobiaceae bacterium]
MLRRAILSIVLALIAAPLPAAVAMADDLSGSWSGGGSVPGLLTNDRTVLSRAVINSQRGTDTLNPDPYFKLLAAGIQYDEDGYPLGGVISGSGPGLVDGPAASPFDTKAMEIPSGIQIADFNASFSNVGGRLGEKFYVTFGVVAKVGVTMYTYNKRLSDSTDQMTLITSTATPPTLGTFGYMELTAEVTVNQAMIDNPSRMYMRLQPTAAGLPGFTDGAWIVGWAIRKTPGPLVNDRSALDAVSLRAQKAAKSGLFGKKVVVLADSIYELTSLHSRIGLATGATVYKTAFGGCAMAQRGVTPTDYDRFSFAHLADAIATGDWSAQVAANTTLSGPPTNDNNSAQLAILQALDFDTVDIIIVGYMANDFYSDVPLGTDTDTVRTTFKGAINYGIQTIQNAFPHIQFIFHSHTWHARTGQGVTGQPTS